MEWQNAHRQLRNPARFVAKDEHCSFSAARILYNDLHRAYESAEHSDHNRVRSAIHSQLWNTMLCDHGKFSLGLLSISLRPPICYEDDIVLIGEVIDDSLCKDDTVAVQLWRPDPSTLGTRVLDTKLPIDLLRQEILHEPTMRDLVDSWRMKLKFLFQTSQWTDKYER